MDTDHVNLNESFEATAIDAIVLTQTIQEENAAVVPKEIHVIEEVVENKPVSQQVVVETPPRVKRPSVSIVDENQSSRDVSHLFIKKEISKVNRNSTCTKQNQQSERDEKERRQS
jgi:hypothetical protein